MYDWRSVEDQRPTKYWLETNGYDSRAVIIWTENGSGWSATEYFPQCQSVTGEITHWMPIKPPGGEAIDAGNPLGGDLVTKVDAYLLGVNTMLKVVEMLAETARGEAPDA